MLEACSDTFILNTARRRSGEHAGKIRILGIILKVTPAQRASFYVEARTQHDVHARLAGFPPQGLAYDTDEVRIP
jgi:hypothetical protein